ncbi:MarR family winged helix-turn-helix transcriptional regulator [Actinoplanes sp. RD1]|uniref:MarR family winged helix-turn-helix transcriptional regulator n=1 Tax=Actinoplanes sp. RD1 TaxID=3064538 RepID=UPI0027424FF5|nr:MarR family transcriptional regulator [Actinoplanes sp. RD1]
MNRVVREGYRQIVDDGLHQATALLGRHLSDRDGPGLTTMSNLVRLEQEGPARVTTLAAGAGVSQPAMTELVQRLAKQGWVERVPDPGDGRATLVAITPNGRAVLDQRRAAHQQRLGKLLATLSDEDAAALELAMHVALPILGRLIRTSARPQDEWQPPA